MTRGPPRAGETGAPPAVASSARPGALALMRHAGFRLAWGSRSLSTLSYQMQAVVIAWQVYDVTRNPLDLGLIGLTQFLPALLLVFVVGHVADRYDRRRVAGTCLVLEAVAAVGLAIGSLHGWSGIAPLLTLVFLFAAVRSFEAPTMQALIPNLVPERELPRAIAWSTSSNQLAIITGPAVGGLLYVAGPAIVYVLSAAIFLIAGVLAWRIPPVRKVVDQEPVRLASVFAGLTYIRGRPSLLGAISLDLFAVLLGGATALLPVYARDILDGGPWALGLLRAAPAVGALAMSLYLVRHPIERRAGRTMLASVAVFGLATIVFGLSSVFALSLAALVVLGASDMVSVVIRSALVQLHTPDQMRGRVNAVNSVFIGTSNQLGEFESGLTAAWFGTVPSVVVGGLGTIAVVLGWTRLFPQLTAIDTLVPPGGTVPKSGDSLRD